jgi:hypothetical protein
VGEKARSREAAAAEKKAKVCFWGKSASSFLRRRKINRNPRKIVRDPNTTETRLIFCHKLPKGRKVKSLAIRE